MMQIGPYNVLVYEAQIDPISKRRYRLCEIQKFVGDTMIQNNFIYLVSDLLGYVGGYFREGLEQICVLEKLIKLPRDSRVVLGKEYTVECKS